MADSFLRLLCAIAVIGSAALFSSGQASAADEDGFKPIFDGKTLKGWDGNPQFWSVRDGAITGQTTDDNKTTGNTFIIWKEGEVADFELKLEYKIVNGNSGIQYRSKQMTDDKWVIGGYQGDFEAGDTFSGINYDEKGRGILAQRGQKTVIKENGKPEVVEQIGDTKELQSHIKKEDWNEYHITAKDFTFTHAINGHVTSIVVDEDTSDREAKGLLALQLHAGPSMTVQFRNIRLKDLSDDQEGKKNPEAKQSRLEVRRDGTLVLNGQRVRAEDLAEHLVSARRASEAIVVAAAPTVSYDNVQRVIAQGREAGFGHFSLKAESPKKIVFIAGRQSHDYGAHEHKAGCMLLQRELDASALPLETVLVTEGWPKDESVFEDANAVVMYADGGGGHPAVAHLDTLKELSDRGVGIVCLHYGVEVPKGEAGEAFLNTIGGYFEPDWSVNPHWVANYDELPQHPITRGIDPFKINDEWYYHMRFRDGIQGVTPILTDVPTSETLSRPDGPHSGNPAVRAAVAKGEPQHMAWAYEGPKGNRGFGFTGGHFHWNWGHDEFRQLVLNAIVWSAGLEVPKEGVPVDSVTVADLEANQDEPKPGDHNPARIEAMLKEWNR
ncbi:MAG: DUF1080 domain-containing protein [Planctomycetota bacterium]|nr:DUF1080 domain-containing protein [Planctomycetota bacterium]